MLGSSKPIANLVTFIASSQITTIISSSGVALVLIALIESRYLMNSLKSTSEKIVYESSNKLDEKLENTFELINNSLGIITLSSTVGWESLLLKKPVMV